VSILTVCQNAARLLSIGEPTQLISSSNIDAKKLLESLIMVADLRRRQYEWPQLIRTCTLTMVSGTSTYSLPDDFLAIINNTHWDVNGSRPLEGPLDSQDWARLTYGVTNSGPYIKYRIAGRTNKRFQVSPTPSSSGSTLAFLYRCSTWVVPADWVTATTYVAGNYVSNASGDIYYAATSGTSGATEPVHTSGTSSDGGVQWTYYTGAYERPMFDTDVCLLDENLLKDDVVWGFRKLNGLDFEGFKVDADSAWRLHIAQIAGAPIINMGGSSEFLIGMNNIPDTGYGI
jgi:hypothetical protein